MAKRLTSEQLARMTHEELLALSKKLDAGFSHVHQRMDRFESRMTQGFTALDENMVHLRKEMHDSTQAQSLISRIIAGDVADLKGRVLRLEKRMGLAR